MIKTTKMSRKYYCIFPMECQPQCYCHNNIAKE